jgi:hypothetical protein
MDEDEAIKLEQDLKKHLMLLVRQAMNEGVIHPNPSLAVATYNKNTGYRDLDYIRNAINLPVIEECQKVLKSVLSGDKKPLALYALKLASNRINRLKEWNIYNRKGVDKRIRKGDFKDAKRVEELIAEIQEEIDSLEPVKKWATQNL